MKKFQESLKFSIYKRKTIYVGAYKTLIYGANDANITSYE
jgi:hypothetical protein